MTVFIESRCVYSKNFINDQLLPIYDNFKDLIHINFITFALSESHIKDDGQLETKCYHGKPECTLDLFQTCSLFIYRNDTKFQHKIIFCTMRSKRFYKACIKELNLDIERIENCTQGETGKYLTLWSQKESAAVIKELNGVPAVIFNGVIDTVVADRAITQLKRVLKTKLHIPKDVK
ncbi:hypothetical protein PVAND_016735 [Polypedilum vanderplanki]|uniref:Thioredoxin-like fold domain-containing protein n=1 Tax=Polypedilum vanderplanki TaxID=319348 RepID=A0A9J6BH24_POLVA|nr:hypothetical protein PVAND_016735 [Polypedilum vanderplanki]